MKEMRRKPEREKGSLQGGFLVRAMELMDPEFLTKTAESNPDFVLDMLGQLSPQALTEAIIQRPGVFTRLIVNMPRDVLRRILEQDREVICEIVRRADSDLLLEMMGK